MIKIAHYSLKMKTFCTEKNRSLWFNMNLFFSLYDKLCVFVNV